MNLLRKLTELFPMRYLSRHISKRDLENFGLLVLICFMIIVYKINKSWFFSVFSLTLLISGERTSIHLCPNAGNTRLSYWKNFETKKKHILLSLRWSVWSFHRIGWTFFLLRRLRFCLWFIKGKWPLQLLWSKQDSGHQGQRQIQLRQIFISRCSWSSAKASLI